MHAGDPDSKKSFVRAKHWSFLSSFDAVCQGKWSKSICVLGVGDLPWVTGSPHMFVNKIHIEQEPTAFRCLELWYRDRVRRQQRLLAIGTDNFNVSIYASQPFVHQHVSKQYVHYYSGRSVAMSFAFDPMGELTALPIFLTCRVGLAISSQTIPSTPLSFRSSNFCYAYRPT